MSGSFNALTKAYTRYNLNKNLVQWGLVYKVMKNVSLFTGSNENFALNGTGTVNGVPGSVLAPKSGKSKEVGLKSNWLDGRFTINISYFDIQQKNNTAPSFPFDPLNPSVLIPGVISRGFDGDWTWKATNKLYIMGSFANYSAKAVLGSTYDGLQGSKFRQPGTGSIAYGSIPVDNTAQQTASFYAVYKHDSQWTLGLGPNWQSKRAVTGRPQSGVLGLHSEPLGRQCAGDLPAGQAPEVHPEYRQSAEQEIHLLLAFGRRAGPRHADQLEALRGLHLLRSRRVISLGADPWRSALFSPWLRGPAAGVWPTTTAENTLSCIRLFMKNLTLRCRLRRRVGAVSRQSSRCRAGAGVAQLRLAFPLRRDARRGNGEVRRLRLVNGQHAAHVECA
jgi:hypothetical protein